MNRKTRQSDRVSDNRKNEQHTFVKSFQTLIWMHETNLSGLLVLFGWKQPSLRYFYWHALLPFSVYQKVILLCELDIQDDQNDDIFTGDRRVGSHRSITTLLLFKKIFRNRITNYYYYLIIIYCITNIHYLKSWINESSFTFSLIDSFQVWSYTVYGSLRL